ncbi:MAG: hypothetical protein PHS29_03085 [Candidatus Pacebacteria bacterium]|nr:hypothetical protein [Candidatus Paceibacterota bacterium]MDD4897586.1 hypothetical protein [Candidatus Paceibacterota bacterium]
MLEYQAIVEKIVINGHHGPYAVARSEDLGLVTFSLDEKVWQEKDFPEPGILVILSDIRKKRAGWRAYSGRFFQPYDSI